MSSGIFVSYRREDSRHAAGRLVDRLDRAFGRDRLFLDVDGIEPGLDFSKVIDEKLSASGVFLAVIGPQWLEARDHQGRRRLDNPGDFVRLELETALQRDVRVIPVLVDGASMPREDELPEPLRPLTRRNAVRLSHESFGGDADKLAAALQAIVARSPAAAGNAATTPPARPLAETDRRQAQAHALWLIVLVAQIAAALTLAPVLKDLLPAWRQYDIFMFAILHTAIISFVAMIATVLSRDAPIAGPGASIVSLVFACLLAAVTLLPQAVQAIENLLPVLRGQRWIYPLVGAITGHLMMTTSARGR